MNYLLAITVVVLLLGGYVAHGYYQARQRRRNLELKRQRDRQTNAQPQTADLEPHP